MTYPELLLAVHDKAYEAEERHVNILEEVVPLFDEEEEDVNDLQVR